MMSNFIVRTLDHLVFVKLFQALEAERVTTRERNWFLIVVIVWLEADATFENLFHYSIDDSK